MREARKNEAPARAANSDAGAAPALARHPHQAHEQQRHHHGELDQDRQRPQVLHRRGVGEHAGEAVAGEGEAPVQHLAQRGEDVAPEPGAGPHPQRGLEGDHQGDREHEQRQDAAGPALPQAGQAQAPVLRPFGQRHRAQEEAGQREEAGDAEEPAPGDLEAGVEGEDGQQRHGPKAVEPGHVGKLGRAPARCPGRTCGAARRRARPRRRGRSRSRARVRPGRAAERPGGPLASRGRGPVCRARAQGAGARRARAPAAGPGPALWVRAAAARDARPPARSGRTGRCPTAGPRAPPGLRSAGRSSGVPARAPPARLIAGPAHRAGEGAPAPRRVVASGGSGDRCGYAGEPCARGVGAAGGVGPPGGNGAPGGSVRPAGSRRSGRPRGSLGLGRPGSFRLRDPAGRPDRGGRAGRRAGCEGLAGRTRVRGCATPRRCRGRRARARRAGHGDRTRARGCGPRPATAAVTAVAAMRGVRMAVAREGAPVRTGAGRRGRIRRASRRAGTTAAGRPHRDQHRDWG